MASDVFADARRSDKAENRTLGILYQLANGKELQNAFRNLVQSVVLFVENFLGGQNVANFLGFFLPGHRQQPIEIVAADRGLRGHGRHQFQALQFLDRLFVDFLVHAAASIFFFSSSISLFFAAAELFLNGLQLFVEGNTLFARVPSGA